MTKTDLKSGWLRAYEQSTSERLWDERPLAFLPAYLDRLAEAGQRGILDIGCGEGRNMEFFAAAGLPTIGLDLSVVALQRADRNAAAKGLRHIALLVGDIDALPSPFAPETVSIVTCLDVFGQLEDPTRVANSFAEILRPGGLLLTNLYTRNDASFGEGDKLDEMTYSYKGTLFKFFDRDRVENIFAAFEILSIDVCSWQDPPHPGYRDEEHRHESFVVLARKKSRE